MTTFAYTALDAAGSRRSGVIEAKDREAAVAAILSEGRYVVDISEKAAEKESAGPAAATRASVSRADLALFTRRLADLALAGLPLDRVLQIVSEQSESATLSQIAEAVLEDVRGGLPVSQALAKHPKYFSAIYTETLRAGEASGQFGEVASRLADFQEKDVAQRSQVTSALIYPIILATVAVGVVIFLLTFVVPRLKQVFDGMKGDLPGTTKVLLATTNLLTQNWVLVVAVLVGTLLAYRGFVATESGAYARDKFFLKAPIIGKVVTKATISRYARVLGTLVFGGVPMLEALRLAGMATGNRVFQRTSEQVADDVRDGRSIHEAMQDTQSFPPVLTHMVAIGEETGDLPKMLGRVSDSLDFEVEHGMRRLTALVEPVIVLVMGAVVLFVVLAILLPVFQAQTLVK